MGLSTKVSLLAVAIVAGGCQKPIELEWSYGSGSGSRSSPALTADMVLFGNEAGYLNAIDRNDGSLRWRFPTSKEVVSSPTVTGSRVYFGSMNYSFYAVELVSGRVAWEQPTHDRIKGSPALAEGLAFIGSYDGHVYAFRLSDHQLAWRFPAAAPEAVPAGAAPVVGAAPVADAAVVPAAGVVTPVPKAFSYARPAYGGGVVYAANLDGFLYAIDAKTGAMRWRFKTGDGITSSPLLYAGVLYFGSNDHRVYALTGLSGAAGPTVKWTFQTGDAVNAPPALDGQTLFVGSTDHSLYALDVANGHKLWAATLQGPVFGRAAVYKNLVFVGAGAGDGRFYAFDTKSGHEFWRYEGGEPGSKIQSDAVLDGDHVFAVNGAGVLLNFQIHKTTGG